jgi:serine/threonine protein kinase
MDRHTRTTWVSTQTGPDATPSPPTAAELPVGSRFDRYEVRGVLGRGGMGVVYEAFDPGLNRPVALKTVLPRAADQAQFRERFAAEARALAAVANDHIVTVHDFGEWEGTPYLVTELLPGQSLEQRATAPLPLTHIVKVGREVANGLAAAHAAGLVHQDVKPENVLFDPRTGRAKLIDFGLAKPDRPADAGKTDSRVAGTPAYMSPEQLTGQPADPRSDLFSFGVLLYRLCTDELPFPGGSVTAWRKALLSDTPPPPARDRNPTIPPVLSDLIARLLAKRPDDRPATAAEVEAVLIDIQVRLSMIELGVTRVPAMAPLTTPPSSVLSLEPAPRSSRRRWLAAAGLLLTLTCLLIWILTRPPRTDPGPRPPARGEPVVLFDGRSLAGWHGVEGKTDQWEVKGGVLIGTHQPKAGDQFLLSDREFTDFELAFEFRWPAAGGHTTVMVRAKDDRPKAEVNPAKDLHRVTGLELNLGDDGEHLPPDKRKPANSLYASGGFYKLKGPTPPAASHPIGEWNAVKVTSDRTRLTVEWNGVVTFDEDLDGFAEKSHEVRALARSKGAIALRTHSGKPIEFRNLVVAPLSR